MTDTFPIHPQVAVLEGSLRRRGLPPPKGWQRRVLPFAPYGSVTLYHHPSMEERHPSYLIHSAFLAELLARTLDQFPDAHWHIPQEAPGALVPDAILHQGRSRMAMEVDLFYPRAKALRKVRYYAQAYDGQIWGTSMPRRERDLRAHAWPKPIQVHILLPDEVLQW